MAIDPKYEWSSLLETLHRDVSDREGFEKNLPEINGIINELSKEKFKNFNREVYQGILALKKEVNSLSGDKPVNKAQAEALSQAIERIYSLKGKGEGSAVKASTTPEKAAAISQPVSSQSSEAMEETTDKVVSKYALPPSKVPTIKPASINIFRPYFEPDEKEISTKSEVQQAKMRTTDQVREECYRKYQASLEAILNNDSSDYSARLGKMSQLVTETLADDVFTIYCPNTFNMIRDELGKKVETAKSTYSRLKEMDLKIDTPENPVPEGFGELLKITEQILHSLIKETQNIAGTDFFKDSKDNLSNILKNYQPLESRLSELQRAIDSLPDLSRLGSFDSKLAKIRQDIALMQSGHMLMTEKQLDDLYTFYKMILGNALDSVSHKIRNFDSNTTEADRKLINGIYAKLLDVNRSLIEKEGKDIDIGTRLVNVFFFDEDAYKYESPKIGEKIKKIKDDIRHFLGIQNIDYSNARLIISANLNKFKDVNTNAFFKELIDLQEMINEQVLTSLPTDVVSIILKQSIISEEGTQAMEEIDRLANLSEGFAKASERPALFADILSKPPGPKQHMLTILAERAGNQLHDLYLGNYALSEDEVKALKEHCPNIQSINLTGCHFLHESTLLELAVLPLRSINLSTCFGFKKETLAKFLAACKGLRTVALPFVNSELIKALAQNNPNIEYLHVPELGLTEDGYQAMQQLKNLRELNLKLTSFKEEKEFIDFLSHFPELETVVLPKTFSQSSLEVLSKQCPNLKNITFISGPFDEGTLKVIDGLFPNLKKLYLGYEINPIKYEGTRREGENSYEVLTSPQYGEPSI